MQEHYIIDSIRRLMIGHNIVNDDSLVLTGNCRLIDELGLDSISMLELVTAIEEEFDITIDFEELDIEVLNLASSFAALINRKIAEREAA
jgi:acyl carrier protein